MKKLLLSVSVLGMISFGSLNAQVQKTPFVEHFTQASCGPCASQNPTMYTTLNTFGSANYIKLTYQVSWPGVDPMNAEYPAGPNDRRNYYAVTGVPDCSLSGGATASPNTAVTANTLAAKAAETTPYSMTVVHSWNNGDITVDVDVTNTSTSSASSMDKIYVSMIEDHITFATAPGSNGETDFYYVNREFYNASSGATGATSGASLGAIAAGATTSFTFTIAGANIPSYIRDLNQLSFVAFVQNNSSKAIDQAAKSVSGNVPGLLDVSAVANSTVGAGLCDLNLTPSVDFTNNGSMAVTTVTAEYSINGGTAVSQTYNTAPIAQGATVSINFPATTLASGTSTVDYSITDINSGGTFSAGPTNMGTETYAKLNASGTAAPMVEGMESAPLISGTGYSRTLTTGIFEAGTITENLFSILDGPTYNYGTIGGFGNSNRSIRFRFFSIASGSMALTMQKVNLTTLSTLTFATNYRQYDASSNDALQVEVSVDCGATWTSVFSESGSTLAHGSASSTASYTPDGSSAGWYSNSVDLSTYDNTNDVIVRFTGTSNYGNNLFLDDINIFNDAVSVAELDFEENNVQIYPNPVNNRMTVNFTSNSSNANIVIINVQGQTVKEITNNTVKGENSVEINTTDLPTGIYTLSIFSGIEVTTKRFVVTK
jgi:hypothetical protein